MNKLERLAYWKSVAVDAVRAADRDGAAQLEAMVWKNEDDLFAFFDCFRPDGRGVEMVFAGVVGGDEILQRLRRGYECTKERFERYLYFVVCRPARATPQREVAPNSEHYCQFRQSRDIEARFAPYFELWASGAMPAFKKAGLVTFYVRGDN